MSLFDSIVQTPMAHLDSAMNTYSEHPEQALLGINTPAEAYMWNGVLGSHYTPTTNMFGGPSEQAYAQGAANGYDMSAGRMADAVAPAVVGGVAGAFGGPMAGMAASKAASGLNEMGKGYERSLGYSGYQQQGYAKGGITAIDSAKNVDKTAAVLQNYFKKAGIPLQAGMAGVKKEVSQGLKLIPYETSVMGFKPLSQGSGQVHFFTIGTLKDLADDMKYFINHLKSSGIKVVYDSAPAPITSKVLQQMGAKIVKSDNPKYPFKAML